MVLSHGDRGERVLEVQRFLQSWGFQITDDGHFGPETETAVESFQSRMGLEADGLVGPDTLAALRQGPDSNAVAPEPADRRGETETAAGLERKQPFTPSPLVAVETPGGGRITDKSEPPSQDVISVEGFGGKVVRFHHLAATFWFELVDAARSEGLAHPLLLPVSGLRSMARQQQLWSRALQKYGSEEEARKWVAKPGASAHHSGRAVDCWLGTPVGREHVADQKRTPAWLWLMDNAERFGFYPYSEEPWHWEYNPPSASSRSTSDA
jgi:LAS superfamily LD-carboxypeptidase LdcB